MSDINFVIPVHPDELLRSGYGPYTVREVLPKEEISENLRLACQGFTENGPNSILDYFNVFFSVIQIHKELPRSTTCKALDALERALKTLPNHIKFALEDPESLNEEQRRMMQNIIKMLTYLFSKLVQALEASTQYDGDLETSVEPKRGRKKQQTLAASAATRCNRVEVVRTLKLLLEVELNEFWDAPGADSTYTNLIADVCHVFLENVEIKQAKETLAEIWDVFGLLVSEYNASELLIMRLVRMVREHEHLAGLMADGIRHIITQFKCQSILKDIVRELTEWQVTAVNAESNGTRFCSKLLVDMAVKMPTEMHSELVYLSNYLNSDSYQLRCMVLAVQVEVVLAHTAAKERTEEQRTFIIDVMHRLEMYTADKTPQVRAKVFAHIARLQIENAIPLTLINHFLKRAVAFLRDTAANVRKAAASCCTTMLRYNCFGPLLSLSKTEDDLRRDSAALVQLQCDIYGLDTEQLKANEDEWKQHVEPLTAAVVLQLEKIAAGEELSDEEEVDKENEPQRNEVIAALTAAVRAADYATAFRHCHRTLRRSDAFVEMRGRMDALQESDFVVYFMHTLFMDARSLQQASRRAPPPTDEQMESVATLKTNVDCLQNCVDFLSLVREAQRVMIGELLNSVTIGDMHEAVNFITTANQFQLDDAIVGVLGILKVMRRNEQDRRKIALESLKSVYLTTDGQTLRDHTTEVIERLIKLLCSVSYEQADTLTTLIAEWAEQGMLGNDMFDTMWKYFLRTATTDAMKSRASLCLLRMAGRGRQSIVEKNYSVVAHVCFGKRVQPAPEGEGDLRLAVEGLRFINLLQKRIPNEDTNWTHMLHVLQVYLPTPLPHVHHLVLEIVRAVFQIGQRPITLIERVFDVFTNVVDAWRTKHSRNMLPLHLATRWHLLLGETALAFLQYMDVQVYSELRRRQNPDREKPDVETPHTASKRKGKSTSRESSTRISTASNRRQRVNSNFDESMMEGADAVDDDADYISNLLENCLISPSTPFGRHFESVISVVRQPHVYSNVQVQHSAVTALLRGMLLSNRFCEQHICLVFMVLARTTFVENKLTILLHMSDLLEKSPNIIEPYTPKLYALLADDELRVREMALKMLAQLTLKDMIRPQEHLWKFAACIVHESATISEMAKAFFTHSAQKSNNLYNFLPDMFTHLCASIEDVGKLRATLSYLLAQIENSKQIESLVERFCLKFDNVTDNVLATHIAFALTQMAYTERALRKLVEQFARYKQFVLVEEVYASLKSIVTTTLRNATTNKKEIEVIASEMDERMNEVFALDGSRAPSAASNGAVFKKPGARPKKTASKRVTRGGRRRNTRRSRREAESSSSSSSSSDEEGSGSNRLQPRRKRGRALRV